MAITTCSLRINEKKQELTVHGTPMFPCGCYQSDIDNTVTGEISWHWHEELELILVHKGEFIINTGTSCFLLKEGEGAFVNSNILHSGYGVVDKTCILHSFVFHSSFISGPFESVFNQSYLLPLLSCPDLAGVELKNDKDWQKEILEYIKEAYEIFQTEEYGFEFLIRELLTHACLQIIKNNRSLLTDNGANQKTESKRIKIMLNFIHEHYNEALELQQIADSANVSRRECLRCFQDALGVSPIQYLMKYRISYAAELLQLSSENITEIGEKSGFASPSYFTKIFQRYTGCSPSEYRK